MVGQSTGEQPPESANGASTDKLTAAQKKRLKQKQRKLAKKAERQQQQEQPAQPSGDVTAEGRKGKANKDRVEIEYVAAPASLILSEVLPSLDAAANTDDVDATEKHALEEFRKVLEHFGNAEEVAEVPGEGNALEKQEENEDSGPLSGSESSDDEGGRKLRDDELAELSKKKRKEAMRVKIAELKQLCERPEVVEVWDVTSADPPLLVHLKSYRNTVPVPRHWSQKRKYLQGKRGLEKPLFKLPAFIEATGIGEMRQAYLEKAEAQKLKQKGRERMQPKMGKLDIDYQILHDAFFRHQTKPNLTGHGELYYEGKEYETSLRHSRPGMLSPALQDALGMEPGAPPPWLVAMQRHGPPPSYPSLRIPGLNAPIPPGAQFGYHTGGWGKPPVDQYGNPIYGDVFNTGAGDEEDEEVGPMMLAHWGDLDEEEEESSEEEAEEEEEEEEEMGEGTASVISGVTSSLPPGMETPVEVQLRKAADAHAAAAPEAPKQLYHVLEEQKAAAGGAGILGTDHTYVVPGVTGAVPGDKGEKKDSTISAAKRLEALRREMPSDVDISIDPADLESLDDETLRDLYQARVKDARAVAGREDFSDLVAAKAAAQKRKAVEKAGGKEKKFKF